MYQFTREFIINDNKGKLKGDKRYMMDGDVFKVEGGCNIRKADVNAVYKATGVEEETEHIKYAVKPATGSIKVGDIVRLTIVLGQENRVHPLFNDYYPDHTQSFFYEAKATTADTIPYAGLNEAIAAEKNRFDNVYFTANVGAVNSSDPTKFDYNATDIDLTMMDCYTRLMSIRLVVVHTDVDPTKIVASNLTAYEDWDVIAELKDRKAIVDAVTNKTNGLTSATSKLGSAGKFTTNYLVQNVRLLTDAAINPYGVNKDERPLPRSVYDQYMVECISERRHIGHQVMGSIDHSLTTFVFFVLQDESGNFKTELAKLAGEPKVYATSAKGMITPTDGVAKVVATVADVDTKVAASKASSTSTTSK